jgi:hypothetical protein
MLSDLGPHHLLPGLVVLAEPRRLLENWSGAASSAADGRMPLTDDIVLIDPLDHVSASYYPAGANWWTCILGSGQVEGAHSKTAWRASS